MPQSEPKRINPPQSWPHSDLLEGVKSSLPVLMAFFKTDINIRGVEAAEVFTLSAALGAVIERQVVVTLNQLRNIWDPKQQYTAYSFVRQPQAFPDVLLTKTSDGKRADVLMGIELKSWYLLAKEKEPSFRFTVTPKVCNPQDLVVIVPWVLSDVISGAPRILRPFVESARYAADYRNYHWEHKMEGNIADRRIRVSSVTTPYPQKSDMISDEPTSDKGKNFGRFARSGIMDEYLKEVLSETISGIEARHWCEFFRIIHDAKNAAAIELGISRLRERASESGASLADDDVQKLREKLLRILEALN